MRGPTPTTTATSIYFVGFRGRPNRFYRNDSGRFVDVAAAVGLADTHETRAVAWGDYNADGHVDLYVGFADPQVTSRVYRNEGNGKRFVDVAAEIGLMLRGVSRQPAWIDYDGDGDLDLFAAFRDGPNRLFRNDRGHYADVTAPSGIGDTRRSVSAVWWDFDRDGDLDLFVANQEGDANGLYRQHQGRFEDVGAAAGVAGAPRPKEDGGVGPSLADFDLDGDFDLFVANYGPSALYRADDGARFTDVARAAGIDLRGHGVTSAWGDVDNDGRPDLYVGNFIAGQPLYRDAFFLNRQASERLPCVRRGPPRRPLETRCDARRALRRFRCRRPSRSVADQQRSGRWWSSPVAQHQCAGRPFDRD